MISPKYRGVITGKSLLLGGVKEHKSTWFSRLDSAKSWIYTIVEGNLKAGRDLASIDIEQG